MTDVSGELRSFFQYIWQDTPGYVYLPIIKPVPGQKIDEFKQAMFKWPGQVDRIVDFVIQKDGEGYDVYSGPAIYKEKAAPRKENILGSHVLWADFDDGSAPTEYGGDVPEPSLRIQSSSAEGNQHAYWLLDEFLTDVSQIEERNRSIAYAYKADAGGWDAVQFLRPPGTTNLGIKSGGRVARPPSQAFRLSEFGEPVSLGSLVSVPSAKSVVADNLSKPENIPNWQDVVALHQWPEAMWSLFNTKKENITDRSGALFRLAALAAESDFNDGSIYAIIDRADQKWEKYTARRDRDRHLIDIINRVRLKVSTTATQYENLLSMFDLDDDAATTKPYYGFKSFIESEFKIEWLIDGLLSKNGMGMFSAAAGTGKTQMTMQLGASVALGRDFLKWKNAGTPKKVAFFSLEMGKEALNLFLSTMGPAYSKEDLALLEENLIIVPTGNEVHMDKVGGQNYFNKMLADIQPDLIIVDSLQASTSKALTDEVAVKELSAFIGLLRRAHNCAVILIHHNRKADKDNPNATPTMDDILGHSLIVAPLDFALALKLRPYTNVVMVANVKNRLAKQIAPFDTFRRPTLTFSLSESDENLGANTSIPDGDGSVSDEGRGIGFDSFGFSE